MCGYDCVYVHVCMCACMCMWVWLCCWGLGRICWGSSCRWAPAGRASAQSLYLCSATCAHTDTQIMHTFTQSTQITPIHISQCSLCTSAAQHAHIHIHRLCIHSHRVHKLHRYTYHSAQSLYLCSATCAHTYTQIMHTFTQSTQITPINISQCAHTYT